MTKDDPILLHQQPALLELLNRAHPRYLDCSGLTLETAEQLGELLSVIARDHGFWLGDLARHSEARWPDTHHQVWPVFQGPNQLSRNAGVCRQYPDQSDRETEATYTQYRLVASEPDRQKRLAEMVDKGQTSDESRAALGDEKYPKRRWILAIDVNYHLTSRWPKAGVESASEVSQWIKRTVNRLREDLGLTDVVCCFDSPTNFRRELTADWDDKYKPRAEKEPEHKRQLVLVEELLGKQYCCARIDGCEADDLLASYANQFHGKVSLHTVDKDLRQTLRDGVNMLLGIDWHEDDHSGQMKPEYEWVNAKHHNEFGSTYNGEKITQIPPGKWTEFQTLAGDPTDGIKGASTVGAKTAEKLIVKYGTAQAAVDAAVDDDDMSDVTTPGRKQALVDFAPKLEITKQLVTLRTDLPVPTGTRIS